MQNAFANHAALISALGATRLAEQLGTRPVTVRAWSGRNRIPPEYWQGVIAVATSDEIDVDADWFMRTTPPRANRAESGVTEGVLQ